MKKGLRLFLLGLVCLFSFVSFGYCSDYQITSNSTISSNHFDFYPGDCIFQQSNTYYWNIYDLSDNLVLELRSANLKLICFAFTGYGQTQDGNNHNLQYYSKPFIDIVSNFSSCPEVNTGEILSGYILESEIDTNYCVGNGYCPTNECTGSLDPVQSGNWSSLFINDIQHIGAGLINITIPEEIEWDYIYTGNGDEFDLNVKGYNVDSDYIEGIINTQNSKPSSQDFNNIITGLIPLFVPGLCIILLIYFIYLFIKKIF